MDAASIANDNMELEHASTLQFSDRTKRLIDETRRDTDALQDLSHRLANRRAELQNELMAVNKAQNSINPACQLIPEILSQIFSYVAHYNPISKSSTLPLLWVTHVCKRWRTIALEDTSLWTTPNFASTDLARLMLDRSKNAPITINFISRKHKATDLMLEALSQVQKLRAIDMAGEDSDRFIKPLYTQWNASPQHLEYLQISHFPRNTTSPGVLIGQEAVSLRVLSLRYTCLAWAELPLAPNLTYLSIEDGVRPPMDECVRVLGRMPLLETLILNGTTPTTLPATTTPSLVLPSLAHLQLTDAASFIRGFLRAVKTPQLEAVTTFITHNQQSEGGEDGFGNILASINARINDDAMEGHELRPQLVDINANYETTDAVYSIWYEGHSSTPTARFGMTGDGRRRRRHALNAELIHQHLDLSTVASLQLTAPANVPRLRQGDSSSFRYWQQELCHGGFHGVRTLAIYQSNQTMLDVFKVMLENPPLQATTGTAGTQAANATAVVVLPNLRKITLSKIIMDSNRDRRTEAMSLMVDVLRARPGITEMEIDGCTYFSLREYKYLTQELPSFAIQWDMLRFFNRG